MKQQGRYFIQKYYFVHYIIEQNALNYHSTGQFEALNRRAIEKAKAGVELLPVSIIDLFIRAYKRWYLSRLETGNKTFFMRTIRRFLYNFRGTCLKVAPIAEKKNHNQIMREVTKKTLYSYIVNVKC